MVARFFHDRRKGCRFQSGGPVGSRGEQVDGFDVGGRPARLDGGATSGHLTEHECRPAIDSVRLCQRETIIRPSVSRFVKFVMIHG